MTRYPLLTVDLDAITDATRLLKARLGAAGFSLLGVTKAVDGEPAVARALLEGGAEGLADSRLHLAIAALGGSASVTAVVADVQMRLDELLRAIPVIPANIAHSDVQHAAIVDAILAGQPDRARLEMEEHIDGTAALLRAFLS